MKSYTNTVLLVAILAILVINIFFDTAANFTQQIQTHKIGYIVEVIGYLDPRTRDAKDLVVNDSGRLETIHIERGSTLDFMDSQTKYLKKYWSSDSSPVYIPVIVKKVDDLTFSIIREKEAW
ncbi:MAG: hypothetical protein WCJ74_02350 [bacterium]